MRKYFLKKRKTNGGQAMLISVVLFLVISLTVVIGFAGPITKEFRVSGDIFNSKQTYFLAESGVEDAYYRIKNNKTIGSSETLTLGTGTATTSITTTGTTQKTIDSLGDVQGGQRKVTLGLKTGSGATFHYGTQSGQGGLYMQNGSQLVGNLYANGSIQGNGGGNGRPRITGDVFVANAPAASADQSNTTPTTPTQDVTFGNTTSTQDIAQSFQLSTDGLPNKVQVYVKKVSTPSDATIRIVANVNGSPGTTTLASGTLSASAVTTSYGWVNVTFTSNPYMTAGTTYWFVIDTSSNASRYYILGANTGYANGQGKIGTFSGTWNNTTPSGLDYYFQFYLGGVNSFVDDVIMGTNGVGDAHAHSISNSDIAGTAYCQSGSANNKSCNTSQADPSPLDWPISDGQIAQWESDAAAGGTSGSLTVSGTQSLGPKKIVGDLTISGTLTILDTIYVTGNINITGTVKLNSTYGTSTGIMIADGTITLGNNVVFQDSGTTGSYIMTLSTSICDSILANCGAGVDAISISNNSNIIIANASKGSINFFNNASVKEVVANRIILGNNVTIQYGSGLINVGFQSGPGGGWSVNGWQETQ